MKTVSLWLICLLTFIAGCSQPKCPNNVVDTEVQCFRFLIVTNPTESLVILDRRSGSKMKSRGFYPNVETDVYPIQVAVRYPGQKQVFVLEVHTALDPFGAWQAKTMRSRRVQEESELWTAAESEWERLDNR